MFNFFSEDLRYAYNVGEIKVQENRLLIQPDLEHLLTTTNLDEVSTILIEAGYKIPERVEEIFLNTESFLSINLEYLYSFIRNLSYHPEITNLFILRYDFRNFGLLLKKKLWGEDFKDKRISEEDVLVNLGLYGLDILKEAFKNKNYEIYPERVQEIFLKVEKEARERPLDIIDQLLEKEYFCWALEVSSSHVFCHYIFETFIDFSNFRSALRLKNIKKEVALFEQFFIEGGRISKADLIDFFQGRLNLALLLFRYSYQKLTLETGGEKETWDFLEKNLDDFLMDILKEVKFSFIGLEPVIAYLLVKELEIKNLRLILQREATGLTGGELLPYLRNTYV